MSEAEQTAATEPTPESQAPVTPEAPPPGPAPAPLEIPAPGMQAIPKGMELNPVGTGERAAKADKYREQLDPHFKTAERLNKAGVTVDQALEAVTKLQELQAAQPATQEPAFDQSTITELVNKTIGEREVQTARARLEGIHQSEVDRLQAELGKVLDGVPEQQAKALRNAAVGAFTAHESRSPIQGVGHDATGAADAALETVRALIGKPSAPKPAGPQPGGSPESADEAFVEQNARGAIDARFASARERARAAMSSRTTGRP